MTVRAEGSRHLATMWRGEKPWHWVALKYGHAEPRRFVLGRGPWRHRPVRFHLTPIHFERWNSMTEIGLCLGRRTLYVLRHR